jgi:NhaA family Na+:H+ antiporter
MKRWRAFLQSDVGSAVPLLLAAVLALGLANSPLGSTIAHLMHSGGAQDRPVFVPVPGVLLPVPLLHWSLLHWINDGLMVVFFLRVGMEIKREVVTGELSQPATVALPIAGALGGILLPAALYALINRHDASALTGWAIPSATDIAFATAIVGLLGGKRVPRALRLFLLTLAVVDDLAAIAVIAVFYTAHLSGVALALAGLCFGVLVALNAFGVGRLWFYLLPGMGLWLCVLGSGVHATLSGVVLAFCLPLGIAFDRLERALRPWTLYLVLPLFAFANAGLDVRGLSAGMLRDPIVIGIVVGLFFGKQLGIFSGAAVLILCGAAKLPTGATWRQLYGVALCGGIGFTMSLFIGTLAFESAGRVALVQLGVLSGSLLSAGVGYAFLVANRSPRS